MKKKRFFELFVVMFTILAMLSACDKEDIDDIDDNDDNTTIDTTYVDSSATGTKNAMAVESVTNTAINSVLINADEGTTKSNCPSVTLSPNDLTSYPKTITIEYDSIACTVGAYPISGKIIAVLSGKIRDTGTTVSITFENYTVDTLNLSGTISLTVDDYSTVYKTITLTTSIQDGSLITPTGTISFTSTKTIKYYFNELLDYTDNDFEISSLSNDVTTLTGETYITEVLETIFITPCTGVYQIVDGVYKITSSELSAPVEIDFGDGDCDNIATVSTTISIEYAGQTYSQDYSYIITLP